MKMAIYFRLITLLMTISKLTLASKLSYLTTSCQNTTPTFANRSQYHTNLNMLFNFLSSNSTSPTGFYKTSVGDGTKDVVYGLFLCRGDQNFTACQNCVVTATTIDLPKKYCPNKKVGYVCYDECIVRYSNDSFFGRIETIPGFGLMNIQNVTGSISEFSKILVSSLNSMAVKAANGGPKKKYATRVVPYTSMQTIYELAECTPDLSARDCHQCLRIAIKQIPLSIGAQITVPSCRSRYENYPFWKGAFNSSLAPPHPRPTNSSNAAAPAFSQPSGGMNATKRVLLAVAVPVAAILVTALAICIYLKTKRSKQHDSGEIIKTVGEVGGDITTFEALQYDFAVLQSATNNFSAENKLGEGGFGGVYKGELSNGQTIAVKKLSRESGQGVQEFKNEVMLIAKLQHRNLVRVLGFCIAKQEKLLVYDYVPNKSLDYYLFDPKKQGKLGWEKRYNILQGIARGMLYLHQDSRLRIIHRDLKASNILLDSNMNPKISDFGMARIFGMDQTQESTSRVVGTYGYMAPEYAMHGQISIKSDVYSFGVLALEIVSGNRNSNFYESSTDEDLLSYAWKKWKDDVPLEFVDPTVRDSCSAGEAIRCIQLGLLCVQESVDQRPTMANVVLAFDTNSISIPLPEEPSFLMKGMPMSKIAKSSSVDQPSSNNTTPWSMNEDSISEVVPR